MVCLFLLPVIAKITTDCLILIGCWKVSLNLIGCLKKLSRRTKWSTPLDWGGSGLYAGAHKKFVPFFWTHFISWQSVGCWIKGKTHNYHLIVRKVYHFDLQYKCHPAPIKILASKTSLRFLQLFAQMACHIISQEDFLNRIYITLAFT